MNSSDEIEQSMELIVSIGFGGFLCVQNDESIDEGEDRAANLHHVLIREVLRSLFHLKTFKSWIIEIKLKIKLERGKIT